MTRPGSLEHFLIERDRFFADRRGRIITAQVARQPWLIQPAEARIDLNLMAPPGLTFDGPPLVHFAGSTDALISAPAIVGHIASPAARSDRTRMGATRPSSVHDVA